MININFLTPLYSLTFLQLFQTPGYRFCFITCYVFVCFFFFTTDVHKEYVKNECMYLDACQLSLSTKDNSTVAELDVCKCAYIFICLKLVKGHFRSKNRLKLFTRAWFPTRLFLFKTVNGAETHKINIKFKYMWLTCYFELAEPRSALSLWWARRSFKNPALGILLWNQHKKQIHSSTIKCSDTYHRPSIALCISLP